MRYAGIIYNDVLAAPGISVSVFLQGCPIHCKGCHNPQTWDPEGGKEFTAETIEYIKKAINANGLLRNLCIMGGEPFAPYNKFTTELIIQEIKKEYPDIKIYVWTGYLYDNLKDTNDPYIKYTLQNIDYLIDGPFIEEQRDITLFMRGSTNQRIISLKNN